MDIQALAKQIRADLPKLPDTQIAKILRFRELLEAENQVQNLSRLISPRDFYEGHLIDTLELLKSGLVRFPAMDLGSGCGVPGLLAAILEEGRWVLAESEGRKADFLKRAVEILDLPGVEVFSGRAEAYLGGRSVETIVARAVGPVGRIFSWIENRSTWNNLVVLKGPGWDVEWKSFGD
jgi:16S rRNA (guanine527-N7)-methyltransferase